MGALVLNNKKWLRTALSDKKIYFLSVEAAVGGNYVEKWRKPLKIQEKIVNTPVWKSSTAFHRNPQAKFR